MPIISKTWPETKWDKMPPEIHSAISTGKRPKPAKWCQIVRILVDEMQKFDLRLNQIVFSVLQFVRRLLGSTLTASETSFQMVR